MCKTAIKIHKASKIVSSESIPDSIITINLMLPQLNNEKDIFDLNELYKDDAEQLFCALKLSLPLGTKYRLLELLSKDLNTLYTCS
jgi:hypothetical protein